MAFVKYYRLVAFIIFIAVDMHIISGNGRNLCQDSRVVVATSVVYSRVAASSCSAKNI